MVDHDVRAAAEKLWNGTDAEDGRIPIWVDCDTGVFALPLFLYLYFFRYSKQECFFLICY
jgi:hypothetical protein